MRKNLSGIHWSASSPHTEVNLQQAILKYSVVRSMKRMGDAPVVSTEGGDDRLSLVDRDLSEEFAVSTNHGLGERDDVVFASDTPETVHDRVETQSLLQSDQCQL